MNKTLATALIAAISFQAGAAEIYKCKRPDGKLLFSDSPCPQGHNVLSVSKPAEKPKPEPVWYTKESLTEDLQNSIMLQVSQNMKDPDSVKIRNLSAGRNEKTKELLVCGEVNAKNAYGGYTGFRGFYIRDEEVVIPGGELEELELIAVDVYCSALEKRQRKK